MKAILAKKQEEEAEARRSHAPVRTAPPAPPKPPAAPVHSVAVAPPPAPAPPRPEPRKIVPQARPAPPIVAPPHSTPAIASRPPAGPIVAKAPAGAVPSRPAVAVVPPPVAVVVKPPVAPPTREAQTHSTEVPVAAVKPQAPIAPAAVAVEVAAAPVAVAPPPPVAAPPAAPVAAEPVEAKPVAVAEHRPEASAQPPSASAPVHQPAHRAHEQAPPPPIRRVVMPQTGPRPVYKAPPVVPGTPPPMAQGGGIQRGKPIFDRRPPSSGPSGPGGPSSYTQRTPSGAPGQGQFPGGPRPLTSTRTPPQRLCRTRIARSPARLRRAPRLWCAPTRRRLRTPATLFRRLTAHWRGASSAARTLQRPRRPSAISKDQGRPDEGLCAASAFWRRHALQR